MNLFPLKIALRYFRAKKGHTAVSIISAISVCAVAVTALAMICVMSVFNGFSGLVDSKMSLLEPELRVVAAKGAVIGNADSLASVARTVEGVKAAQPTITENALAIYGNRQIPITVKGVRGDYDSIVNVRPLILPDGGGEFLLYDEKLATDMAVMSIGAATSVEARPGYATPCYLYAPKRVGPVNVANPASAFRRIPVMVAGVFELKQPEYDQNYVLTSLEVARRLYDYTKEATAVEIALKPGAGESRVMSALSERLGDSYRVENRLMQHDQSLKLINVEKWISTLLLTLILVVASFNVFTTLAILIFEKRDSIATLHALGADNATVARIFVLEGWMVSLAGAVAGVVVGVILCLIQEHFGVIRLSADTSNLLIDTYPVAVSLTDTLIVFGIVSLVGFAASAATVRAMRSSLRK